MSAVLRPEADEMLPDYGGGSILNLMRSIGDACGCPASPYAPLHHAAAQAIAGSERLVLLVIDGLGEALLREAGQGSRLAAQRVGTLTSMFPSTTAAAVTTLLSGLAPAQHGLTGWHMYFAEAQGVLAVLPLTRRLPRPLPDEVAAVPPPARLFDHAGLFARAARECHVVSPADIAGSPFNAHHTRGARVHGYAGRDELFDSIADIARGARAPCFVHAYYDGLDSLSHRHGAYGDIARAELAALDAGFTRLLEALAGSGTTLIVTADHGFIDSPPERSLDLGAHPALGALLEQPLCGEPRVAYCYVRRGFERDFEAEAAYALGHALRCVRSEILIEAGWFGPQPRHPRLPLRVGTHTLLMREDWTLRDWLPGERRFRQLGVHGGISKREMQVPLIVATA